jgi:hypothetical protein
MKIAIVSLDKANSSEHRRQDIRIFVPQPGVGLIKKEPKGAAFDFSVVDPQFQRYIQRAAQG